MTRWPAAAAVAAALLTQSAYARFDRPLQPCDNRPPAGATQPVTVPVSVFVVPGRDMFARCRKQPSDVIIYGCTFLPSGDEPALVLINGDQSPGEQACTLLYEKAHLPPNNWLDPAMEARTPDAKPSIQASR
jgi:hypothetical protein